MANISVLSWSGSWSWSAKDMTLTIGPYRLEHALSLRADHHPPCSLCGTTHNINDTVWKGGNNVFCDYCANLPEEGFLMGMRLTQT